MVNKLGNDSKIVDLVDELQKSFPRLDDWVGLYETPSMKVPVVEVYKHVIAFAKSAIEYFERSSSKYFSFMLQYLH